MSRHSHRRSERSSSHSSSHWSSRPSSYVQSDLDKAYQDLSSYIRREDLHRRYAKLDDQDRPLANVWEGVQGLMEHVPQPFPMPDKAVEEAKQQQHSQDKTVSKRSVEESVAKSTMSKRIKNDVQSNISNSQVGTKEDDQVGEGKEDVSFVVLDSCGEVEIETDDIEVAFDDEEEEQVDFSNSSPEHQDTGDLMLAFAADDIKEEELCVSPDDLDDLPVPVEDKEPLLDDKSASAIPHSIEDKDYNILDIKQKSLVAVDTQHAVSQSIEQDLCNIEPTGTVSQSTKGDFHSIADSCHAVPRSFKHNHPSTMHGDTPSLGAKQDSQKVKDEDTNSMGIKRSCHKAFEPERMFYEPCSDVEPTTLMASIRNKFTEFDKAINALGKRLKTIKNGFLKKSRMRERIKDWDLLRVTELISLTVALFSEMEILRLTQNPSNTSKFFQLPLTSGLSKRETKNILAWYRTLALKLERFVTTLSNFLETCQNRIFQFNSSSSVKNHGAIRTPKLPYFTKRQYFTRFIGGQLEIYKVSSFLVNTEEYGFTEDILSPAGRENMWGPCSLYSEMAVMTFPVESISEVERITYKPLSGSAVDEKILQSQFAAFDEAIKKVCERMDTIIKVFAREDIKDSDLLKVSELGCVAAAVFAEMESLRLTLNPKANSKVFSFPTSCQLNIQRQQMFSNWYIELTKRLEEEYRTMFSQLLDFHDYEVNEFNDTAGLREAIRVPGLYLFTKADRFSRFQDGSLKVYHVSPLVNHQAKYEDNLVNPTVRQIISTRGTVYAEQLVKTGPKASRRRKVKADDPERPLEMSKSGFRAREHPAQSIDEEYSVGFSHDRGKRNNNDESIRHRLSKISEDSVENPMFSQPQTITSKDHYSKHGNNVGSYGEKNSHLESHGHAPKHTQMVQDEMEIPAPDSFENHVQPMEDTSTYLNHDEILESWKIALKKVRKRLFFLEDKMKKMNNSEESIIKVCEEMAKHSKSITELNSQFREFRSCVQMVDIPVDLNQIHQLELTLRLLQTAWKRVFFSNLETFQAYNNREDLKKNGLVIAPKKLEKFTSGPPDSMHGSLAQTGGQENEIGWPPSSHPHPQHQQFHHKPYGNQSLAGGEVASLDTANQALAPPPLPPYLQSKPELYNQRQFDTNITDKHCEPSYFTSSGCGSSYASYSNTAETYSTSGFSHQNRSGQEFGSYSTNPPEMGGSDYHQGSYTLPCSEQDTYQTSMNFGYNVSSSRMHGSQGTAYPVYQMQRSFTGNLNEPTAGFRPQNTATQSWEQYATDSKSLSTAKASQPNSGNWPPSGDHNSGYSFQSDGNTAGPNSYNSSSNSYSGSGVSAAPGALSGNAPSATNFSGASGVALPTKRFGGPSGYAPSASSPYSTSRSDGLLGNAPSVTARFSSSMGSPLSASRFSGPSDKPSSAIRFSGLLGNAPTSAVRFSSLLGSAPTSAVRFRGLLGSAPTLAGSSVTGSTPSGARFRGPAYSTSLAPSFDDPSSSRCGVQKCSLRTPFRQSPNNSADPAAAVDIYCPCNYSCGGVRLLGFPTTLTPDPNTAPETVHWLKLSLLLQDINKLSKMLNQANKGFEKLLKTAHRKASKICLDVSATLPHLSEVLNRLQVEHHEHKFPMAAPKEVPQELFQKGVTQFTATSLEAVEKALCKAYNKTANVFDMRKPLILRYHHHAGEFRAARKCLFKDETDQKISKRQAKRMKKKGNKANLKTCGVFAADNDESKEKIKYYQTLLTIQRKVSNVQRDIQARAQSVRTLGAIAVASDPSILNIINNSAKILLDSHKNMVRMEVFREMYGRNVPRYVQSLLKRGGSKKSIDTHINNYDFNFKRIQRAAKELKNFVDSVAPYLNTKLPNLEIFDYIDVE